MGSLAPSRQTRVQTQMFRSQFLAISHCGQGKRTGDLSSWLWPWPSRCEPQAFSCASVGAPKPPHSTCTGPPTEPTQNRHRTYTHHAQGRRETRTEPTPIKHKSCAEDIQHLHTTCAGLRHWEAHGCGGESYFAGALATTSAPSHTERQPRLCGRGVCV